MIVNILEEYTKEELLKYIKINNNLFLKETTCAYLAKINSEIKLKANHFDYQSILEICIKNPNFDEAFFNILYGFYSKIKYFEIDSLAPDKDLSSFLTKNKFFNSLKKLSDDFPDSITHNSILYASYIFSKNDLNKFKHIVNETNILNYKKCVKEPSQNGDLTSAFDIIRETKDPVKKENIRSFYNHPEIIAIIINESLGFRVGKDFNEYSNILDLEMMSGLNLFNYKNELKKHTLFFHLIAQNKASLLVDLLKTGYSVVNDDGLENFNDFKDKLNQINDKNTQKKDIDTLLSLATVQYEKKLLLSVIDNEPQINPSSRKRI